MGAGGGGGLKMCMKGCRLWEQGGVMKASTSLRGLWK